MSLCRFVVARMARDNTVQKTLYDTLADPTCVAQCGRDNTVQTKLYDTYRPPTRHHSARSHIRPSRSAGPTCRHVTPWHVATRRVAVQKTPYDTSPGRHVAGGVV